MNQQEMADLMRKIKANRSPMVAIKPTGTIAPFADTFRGVHVQFESPFTRLWEKYVCMLCERECYLPNDGVWVHRHSDGPWCPRDKQHGPKTRRCRPVPGLIVINEQEEPWA